MPYSLISGQRQIIVGQTPLKERLYIRGKSERQKR